MRPVSSPSNFPSTEPRSSELALQQSTRLASSVGIAARSILESQAIEGTIASVVADRALDHHREGLFQYAAIRVGLSGAAALIETLEQQAHDARVELSEMESSRAY